MIRIILIFVCLFGWTLPAVAQEKKQTDFFPQFPENLEVQTFAGNWQFEMVDSIDGEKLSKFVILKPPYTRDCQKAEDETSSFCRYTRNIDVKWQATVVSAINDFPRGLQISGRSMKFKHSYGTMGRWGSDAELVFSGNTGEGHWETRDRSEKKGKESWDRLVPTITKVEFYSVNSNATDTPTSTPTSKATKGKPGRVNGVYEHKYWHEDYWPRPEFFINIYGDNLWGFHVFDVKDGLGMTANSCSPIGADARFNNMKAIGLQCSVKLWPRVTNGPKTLRLDHLDIPFVLDIKGLPELAPPEDIDDKIMVKIKDLVVNKTPYQKKKTNLTHDLAVQREKLEDRKSAVLYRKTKFDAEFNRFTQTVSSLDKSIKPFRDNLTNISPDNDAAYKIKKAQLWVEQQDYNRRYKLAENRVKDTVLAYDKALADFESSTDEYVRVYDKNLESDLGVDRELIQISIAPAFLAKAHDRRGALRDLDTALQEAKRAMERADLEREKSRLEMIYAGDMVELASERLEANIYASYTSQALVEAGLQIRDAIKNAKNGPAAFSLWAGVRLTENLLKPPKIYEPDYKLAEGYAPYQDVLKGYHVTDGKALETAISYANKKNFKYAVDKTTKQLSKDYFQKQMSDIMIKRLGMPLNSPDVSALQKMFEEQNKLFEDANQQLKDKSFRSGAKNFTAAWGKDIITEQVKGALVEDTKRYLAEFFEGQAWRSYIATEQDFAYAVRVFRMNGNIYWRNRDVVYSLRGLKKSLNDIEFDADTGFQFERNDEFELKPGAEIWLFYTGAHAAPQTGVDRSPNERQISVFLEGIQLKRVQNSNRFTLTRDAYYDLAATKKDRFTLKIQYD